jgi:hypothetical protein
MSQEFKDSFVKSLLASLCLSGDRKTIPKGGMFPSLAKRGRGDFPKVISIRLWTP